MEGAGVVVDPALASFIGVLVVGQVLRICWPRVYVLVTSPLLFMLFVLFCFFVCVYANCFLYISFLFFSILILPSFWLDAMDFGQDCLCW